MSQKILENKNVIYIDETAVSSIMIPLHSYRKKGMNSKIVIKNKY